MAVSEVRLALRRLAEQLEATGMQVLDDGSYVQLAPEKRFHDAVAHLIQPKQLPLLGSWKHGIRWRRRSSAQSPWLPWSP